ncbi:TPA: two-component system sensor histidine kinase ZraS [Escherichia coli]
MRFMQRSKDSLAKWLSAILPVVIVGLVGLFAVTVIRDYGRETAAARQTLLEKGSVLIRALESGSRVGMGMRMHHAQQQALLEEMAGQPGVRWFAVTDEQGTIVMHSNSGMVGKQLYSPQEMQQLHPGDEEAWRRIDSADGEPVLEIYRQFQPIFAAGMHRMRHMQQYAATPQAIFIAFDASNIVSAEDREQRNTLIILFALATVLLASVLSFFWYRRYLRSRQLLQDEMKRKEKLVALGHLAAGVAHEIRNPLSSIKGLAKEADRLNRVVSELLELVKPTHLALQAVDLNTLINHSLQLVSQDANSREIQLRFTANDALPEIQADPDRLTQVLLNLYLNAIQAIGQHGVISVTASESGTGVKISVTDSGKGIAADQLEAIFTPYFTTKAEGTGLGLAVVHNIVEQHGGTIQVASQEGKGATFTLWLPVTITRKDPQG